MNKVAVKTKVVLSTVMLALFLTIACQQSAQQQDIEESRPIILPEVLKTAGKVLKDGGE